jgi:hypothetical protein
MNLFGRSNWDQLGHSSIWRNSCCTKILERNQIVTALRSYYPTSRVTHSAH